MILTASLTNEELAELFSSANNISNYFCLGKLDTVKQIAVFICADLQVVEVPLSIFEVSGDGTKPDFEDFEIIDYGQTVRFGDYESEAMWIIERYKNNVEG